MRYITGNLREFQICNISKWHEFGYTGKGIKIAEIEACNPNLWFFDGKLKDPLNIGNTKLNTHGQKVLDIIHQAAPDAELFMLPSGTKIIDGRISGDFFNKALVFAMKEGIHIINASLGGIDNEGLNKEILKVQDKGTVFVASCGNNGINGVGGYARSNVWISVAAVHLQGKEEIIKRASYSSVGEALDFSSFSNLYIHDAVNNDRVFRMIGTSFSSPLLAGMLALVQQFFKEKSNRTLKQEEIYQFIKDYCIDLGELGFDKYHGYGLFVLPDPENIDINKYLGGANMEIKLKIGSKIIEVDGVKKEFDTAPFIKDNRTFIPIRFIAEELGFEVKWDGDKREVTLLK